MTIDITARIPVIEAIQDGVAAHGDLLAAANTGPVTFDHLDYPHAQVLPENSSYQGGNEWSHTVRLNLYFERDRESDYLEQLRCALNVVGSAIEELSDREEVGTYRPEQIEDFAGELDGTLLLLISIQLRATSSVDLADS